MLLVPCPSTKTLPSGMVVCAGRAGSLSQSPPPGMVLLTGWLGQVLASPRRATPCENGHPQNGPRSQLV